MHDPESIAGFYACYNEGNRLVASKAGKLEFLMTMKALKPFLSPEKTMIELGSGHGIYIEHLCSQVKWATGSDLVDSHVEILKAKFRHHENVDIAKLDATDLSSIQDNTYDLVVCLGPYYHLGVLQERRQALCECRRICKAGGIIAVAYINRHYANAMYVKNGIYFSRDEYLKLESGDTRSLKDRDAFLGISHFTTPEEIEAELHRLGLKTMDHLGTDGVYGLFPKSLEAMNDPEYEALVEYHEKTCREPCILGMSSHALILVRK